MLLKCWHEKKGVRGIVLGWLAFYLFFLFFGGFFRNPLEEIFSGYYWQWWIKITTTPFPHEWGGYWFAWPRLDFNFFLYALISSAALITAVLIRLRTDMSKTLNRRVFFAFYWFTFFMVLLHIARPILCLAHYVIDLGWTTKRRLGAWFLPVSVCVWSLVAYFMPIPQCEYAEK